MIALITAVFVASLVGSLHCAGMCGAFVAFAVGLDGTDNKRGGVVSLNAAYNIGRLVTYTAAGVIAGSLGGAFDMLGGAMGVQRVMALVAGLSMVVFGALAVLRLNGVSLPKPPVPRPLQKIVMRAHGFAMNKPPVMRALIVGLATTLLPCGWLYAFVLLAAGTASPVWGGVTMIAFWMGTLPVLLGIGVGVRKLADRLGGFGRRVPVVAAMVIVVAGMMTVMNRARLTIEPPRVYAAGAPAGGELMERVEAISRGEGVDCHDDGGSATIAGDDAASGTVAGG